MDSLTPWAAPAAVAVAGAVGLDSIIADYTGLELPARAAIAAAGVATCAGGAYLDELVRHSYQSMRGRLGRAAAMVVGFALENAALTYAVTHQTRLEDMAKVGFLQLLAYGAYRVGKPVVQGVRSLAQGTGRTLAKGVAYASLALAAATAVPQLDFHLAAADKITPFRKAGFVQINEEKLGAEVKRDWRGRYVEMHLPPGGTIYSDIVSKHTDVLEHSDIMAATDAILKRSGYSDASALTPQDAIKVPLTLLSARYIHGYKDPAEFASSGLEQMRADAPASLGEDRADPSSLRGKHVILDAGHGGSDPGAQANGVVEDEAAYDVMVRLKLALERRGATVHPIVEDRESGYEPVSLLRNGREEYVLVTPPYRPGDGRVAANLRAYKVQDLGAQLRADGVREDDIISLHIHADSLAADKRGVMVYYPSAEFRDDFKRTSKEYRTREEVQRHPRVKFEGDKAQSEALSYRLAESIVEAAGNSGVSIHADKPIRGQINNGKDTYIPVMLKPAKIGVLVEVANLTNPYDARAIATPNYRELVARSIADGLVGYSSSTRTLAQRVGR